MIVVEVADNNIELSIAESATEIELPTEKVAFNLAGDVTSVGGDQIQLELTQEEVVNRLEETTINVSTNGLGQLSDVFNNLASTAASNSSAAESSRLAAEQAAADAVAINASFSGLLNTYQTAVDSLIGGLSDDIDSLEDDTNSLTVSVNALGVSLASQITRVDGISTSVSTLSTNYNTLSGELSALSSLTTELNAEYDTFSAAAATQLTALATEVGSYSTRIETVETSNAAVVSTVSALSDDVTGQASAIDTLTASLGTETNRIDQAVLDISGVQTTLGDGVSTGLAFEVSELSTTVGDGSSGLVKSMNTLTTSVTDQGTAISAMNTVELDVNGFVTGYKQTNDGSVGSFTITADTFNLVNPNTSAIMLQYNTGAGSLDVVGTMRLLGDVIGYANFNDKPLSLGAINVSEGSKLGGIADGADRTAEQLAGTGINLCKAGLSGFGDESITPSFFTSKGLGAEISFSPAEVAGSRGITVRSNFGGGASLYVGANSSDFSVSLTPNSKYILSAYVKAAAASVGGQLTLRTNQLVNYSVGFTTSATVGEWVRVSGVLDLSSAPADRGIIYITAAVTGVNVTFEGLMLERQLGDLATASPYLPPGAEPNPVWSNIYDDGNKPADNADNTVTQLNTTLDVNGTIRGINIEANSFKTNFPGFSDENLYFYGDIVLSETQTSISSGTIQIYEAGLTVENSIGHAPLWEFDEVPSFKYQARVGYIDAADRAAFISSQWKLNTALRIDVDGREFPHDATIAGVYSGHSFEIHSNDMQESAMYLYCQSISSLGHGLEIYHAGTGYHSWGLKVQTTEMGSNGGAAYFSGDVQIQYGDLTLSGDFTQTSPTYYNFPLSANWSNYDNGYHQGQYLKVGNLVKLLGLVRSNNTGTVQTVGTLPAGFRPAGKLIFICMSGASNGIARVDIYADGKVEARGVGSMSTFFNWVSLSNITFAAAN